jgi:hypothetical protein
MANFHDEVQSSSSSSSYDPYPMPICTIMAPEELRNSAAQVDASRYPDAKPPALVALFLIKFDLKVG